eukprot:scaffold2900_cov30-Tisochrysis_lutea.AAC.3
MGVAESTSHAVSSVTADSLATPASTALLPLTRDFHPAHATSLPQERIAAAPPQTRRTSRSGTKETRRYEAVWTSSPTTYSRATVEGDFAARLRPPDIAEAVEAPPCLCLSVARSPSADSRQVGLWWPARYPSRLSRGRRGQETHGST